jgi:cephalosporin hydroxylase
MSVEAGPYFVEGEQPPLSPAEDEIVRRFHELYYRRWLAGADTINLSWFGHQLLKCPFDVWLYQELLVRNRPDVVVETGTWQGGSALFMAMILDQIGEGRVITVDNEYRHGRPEHPRITYLTGSSIDPAIVAQVWREVGDRRAMVILDSDHRQDHVYNEMHCYSQLVQVGDYLIVEDTNINGHPAFPDYGPGPMEAVNRFLSETDDFVIDERCQRFMMTLNPRGYLRRVARSSKAQAASIEAHERPAAEPQELAPAQSSEPRPEAAKRSQPQLSIVVVVYNIPREAPRTLHSLSAIYQRNIDADDYEVIVVDNGSNPPLDPALIEGLVGNFRLVRIDQALPSPAYALNRGLAEAKGDIIGVMIDGARIVTPGVLHYARHAAGLYDRAVVVAPGWYLGGDFQGAAITRGYDRDREDALLASINWPEDGYRLFEISTLDESSLPGWFGPLGEANCLFLRREVWQELGGCEERFDMPGGGLLNLDTYRRALELPGARLVSLVGEGSFHQFHGGVATNAPIETFIERFDRWHNQYKEIRGREFEVALPKEGTTYVGTLPRPALAHFVRLALRPLPSFTDPPLGLSFDRELWSLGPPVKPAGPTIAALVELAHQEFRANRWTGSAAVARLARELAPDEPEPQRLLSMLAPWLPPHNIPPYWLKEPETYYLALGEANRILGEVDKARWFYRAALDAKPDLPQAHIGLALLRMPGPIYYEWLDRLHQALAPPTVIEIGVYTGASLAMVRPPSVAIGVDPNPKIEFNLRAETHIFPETSDDFFARQGPADILGNKPLGLGFIDGLHLYEQALRDFINLEAYCGPKSVILFHDTVPLDEPTQRRSCETTFHTGDVWKIVPCLKELRPDLDIFTIATPWTGLTVVTGLDPSSRVLKEGYDNAVAKFIELPFSTIEHCMETSLNMVANDWTAVETRLKARGVL